MHLAVEPLKAIGDDQSRACDIPTGPCSQSIGNDGSFIVKSNELLAQITGVGAQLPLVHAGLGAEREATFGSLVLAPAA